MPTLVINGSEIEVDDSFLSLSPEDQEKTVDEIAMSLGKASAQPSQEATIGNKIGAAIDGVAQGLTFNYSDEIAAGLATGFGLLGDYDQAVQAERARMAENKEKAGGYSLAGEIAGGLTTGAGLLKAGLSTLPRFANAGLRARLGAGAAEGAAYGAAYGSGAAEGGLPERAVGAGVGAATGGVVGAATPVVGAGLRAGGQAAYNSIAPKVRAVMNPQGEAVRRVGEAFKRDALMGQRPLTAADEANAAINNQQLMNFDRGGETVRALTRSVTNQSPESRGVIERVVSDRFEGQGARARDVLSRVANGQVDDLAFQDQLKAAARQANNPAYKKAENSPAAQSMWHEGFEQLMQSPAIQKAAKEATGRGANRAAVEGFTPIRQPFNFDEAGRYTLKTNPDGSIAKPNLRFWDQVKRNLDDQIGAAKRSGEKAFVADLQALKGQLVGMLDDTVPEYATARKGAAAFFDAEDALDAGRKFVSQNKDLRKSFRAIGKMNTKEREAFKVGFAAELSEKLSSVNDRRNVINQIFKSDSARKKVELALGKDGAKELEQFVKIEAAMDMMRNALGNSTTARQLVELGIGAGVGGYQGGWDGAAIGAMAGYAVGKGRGLLAEKAQEEVMRRVAKILLSENRADLAPAARQIAKSAKMQKALDQIMDKIQQGASVSTIQQVAPIQ